MELTPELQRCLQIAKNYGCSRDQIQTFLELEYVPLPWQWEFHAAAREADVRCLFHTDNPKVKKKDCGCGPVEIGLGGARGPGKSHGVLSQAGLDDCQRVKNLKGLFLRQTGKASQESFDDLIDKTILGRAEYKRSAGSIKFANGSRIVLGGFKDNKDIDKYIGIEYDFIIIEELNQITEDKYEKLKGSLRTSKPNWRPRIYTSFNPGGLGHKFVRDTYIVPFREKKETKTRFIGSTYKDNPYLNMEYTDYLESLTGDLGRAWREGDWDLFAGQVFHEWNYDKHVMSVVLPNKSFDHYLSFDWGYSKKSMFASYASVVIEMKTDDGQKFNRVITYNEWAGNQINPEGWAEKIYKDTMNHYDDALTYMFGYCDPAMFNPGQDGSVSIAKRMTDKWRKLNGDNWTPLKPGTRNRLSRVATVHDWLSIAPDGRPYWMVTENCNYLINSLPLLIYNDTKGNKDDVDTDSDDHGYDSISYFLTQVKFIGIKTGFLDISSKVIAPAVTPRDKDGNELAFDLEKWGEELAEESEYNNKQWKF
ncbi:MAG: hypothetical protein GY861_03130 [bacterium]|nr:hypothetical protein [bacterium]